MLPCLMAAVLFSMAHRALLSFFLDARSSFVNGRLRGDGLAGSRATHSWILAAGTENSHRNPDLDACRQTDRQLKPGPTPATPTTSHIGPLRRSSSAHARWTHSA